MAENYKHLYEQMKKMVAMYQDEIVPGMRKAIEDLEKDQIKVRCKGCKFWEDGVPGCTDHVKICSIGFYMVGENGYCVFGERKDDERKAD